MLLDDSNAHRYYFVKSHGRHYHFFLIQHNVSVVCSRMLYVSGLANKLWTLKAFCCYASIYSDNEPLSPVKQYWSFC